MFERGVDGGDEAGEAAFDRRETRVKRLLRPVGGKRHEARRPRSWSGAVHFRNGRHGRGRRHVRLHGARSRHVDHAVSIKKKF